jgi:DNA uptake protein ComE-like DNA-binding protein
VDENTLASVRLASAQKLTYCQKLCWRYISATMDTIKNSYLFRVFFEYLSLKREEYQQVVETWRQAFSEHILSYWPVAKIAALVVAGCCVLGLTVFTIYKGNATIKPEMELRPRVVQASSPAQSSAIQTEVRVDISGAVVRPGVVILSLGARIADALDKAGGYTESADRNYVDQALNLAQRLNDGDKIYIPAQNQWLEGVNQTVNTVDTSKVYTSASNPAVSTSSTAPKVALVQPQKPQVTPTKSIISPTATPKPSATPAGPVSINSATLSELDTLPGIGPAYAQKIIDGRPYIAITDLCDRKIVRSDTCLKIQSLISL